MPVHINSEAPQPEFRIGQNVMVRRNLASRQSPWFNGIVRSIGRIAGACEVYIVYRVLVLYETGELPALQSFLASRGEICDAPQWSAPISVPILYAYIPSLMQGWGTPTRLEWHAATLHSDPGDDHMRVVVVGGPRGGQVVDAIRVLPFTREIAAARRRDGQEISMEGLQPRI